MALSQEDIRWVEDTLATLTVREKIGQTLVPRLTRGSAGSMSIPEWVEKYQMGGGHIFGGDMTATRELIAEAQSAAKIPLLITGDLERGVGQRVDGSTEFAGQLALGACGDEDLAYRMGEAIAVEGTAYGFNWVFGPVVDLSINPRNLSTIRTLGSDPEQVARLGCAVIRGIQDHGMAATAKHFPGGGITDLDSHLTTPVNTLSKEEWYRMSAVPFKAAIDSGVWSIMNSPAACPAIDPEAGDPLFPRPVMVSRSALEGVLRQEMGFEGLFVTDAVTMAGLTMHERRLPMHLACLNAGNDVLLFVRRLDSLVEYLERCLDDGSLAQERLDDAVRRVLTLKAKIGLHKNAPLMPDEEARRIIATSPYGADAERLTEKSLTLIRDGKGVLPQQVKPGMKVLSVLITNRPDFTTDVMDATLTEAGCEVTTHKNPQQETLYDRIEAGEWDAIIVSLYYPPQWGWSTPRCHGPESRCLMDGFPFANPDVPAIFISFANPYHLYEFAFMDPYINTYGGAPGTQRATARAVLGQLPFLGKSPVAQPPFFEVGDGVQR